MLKELIEIIRNLDPDSARALCLLVFYYSSILGCFIWLGEKIELWEKEKKEEKDE